MIRRIHAWSWQRQLAFALVAFIALPLGWGLDPSVVVSLARNAELNGVPVQEGRAVQVGDRLHTSSDGLLHLAMASLAVEFGHKTSVEIVRDGLKLHRGYLHVRGSITVIQGLHRLEPVGGASEFEVVQLAGGQAYLHVIAGAVDMSGFVRSVRVPEGKAVSYQQAEPTAAGQETTPNQQTGAAPDQQPSPDQQQANPPSGQQTTAPEQQQGPTPAPSTEQQQTPPQEQQTTQQTTTTTPTTTTTTTTTSVEVPPLESFAPETAGG